MGYFTLAKQINLVIKADPSSQCLLWIDFEIYDTVMILADEELFFRGASMGLCFGFLVDMVLMSQGCFSSHSIKAFCTPHTAPPARGLGVHKDLGEDTAGPTDQRDHMAISTSCSAYKTGRRRRNGGHYK